MACSDVHRNGRTSRHANCIVLMGVSGTGKSTLGTALASAMCLPFIDGDDLHPAANVAKMARGEPLDDADRLPWLEAIRKTAVACVMAQSESGQCPPGRPGVVRQGEQEEGRRGVIVACSALKKTYRAVLRGEASSSPPVDVRALPTYFVYLEGDKEALAARMRDRQGHFMKVDMLESQLDTLERPEGEAGVVTVSVEMSTEEQVRRVVDVFGSWGVVA